MATLLCPTVVWDTVTNTEHYQAFTQTLTHSRVTLHATKTLSQNKPSWTFQSKSTLSAGAGLFRLYYIRLIVCSEVIIRRGSSGRSWTKNEGYPKAGEVEEGERARGRRNFVQGKKSMRDPIVDGWQQLIWIFLCIFSSLLMLCSLDYYTAFFQKSTSGMFLIPLFPVSLGPSILGTAVCGHESIQIQLCKGGFGRGRRWLFSGRSTFCAISTGQSISFQSEKPPRKVAKRSR